MNDDIFDDELELNERGADQDGSPRVSIAAQPIRDGSRALLHDGYDVQLFHDAAGEYPRLAELIASTRERLITAPALICDVFWSFFKHAPEIQPVVPLTPAHQLHANILEHLMATREWHEVRAAGTIGDVFNSAVATIGAAESALNALSAAVVAAINHLHELESGASDLFAQAQALADETEQAEGDAGAELFAQAARAEAEELERAQQQAAEAIAAQAEPIEDTTRRAARAGMRAAAEQIEAATAAIKTFGGGYGPGMGLENGALTTKEKIALASQVGRSRRLKQVAALCGRLTRIALHVQSTRVQYPPDEIADITYGSDIGHVLPSELALLADPTLELLFFHRYAEGQLMQYELAGNEKQGQGPIILAVDTSGSMTESLGGIAKDVWAKAVMLALMAIARLQERDMVAFLFSGSAHELTRFDFPKGRAP
ncbi:MAG TPA: hypothetical protein VF909_12440, partial [Roseiflexaceae bacterium]